MTTRIRVTQHAFIVMTWFWGGQSVPWTDIAAVSAANQHKLNRNEIVLIFHLKSKRVVTVSEYAGNFSALERGLLENLAGFDADWYSFVQDQQGDAGILWQRPPR